MRKYIISVPMICLLLLNACGARQGKNEAVFEDFRRGLLDAAEVKTQAALDVTAGSTDAGYVLDVTWDGSETVMEIRKPALIAGVRAIARWGEGTVAYEGVMLGAGPIDGAGHTPVSAVPAILDAMAGGYTELLWREGDYLAARLYVEGNVRCTVWLEPESLIPAAAELSEDGTVLMTCTFSGWQVTAGTGKQNQESTLQDRERG